MYIQKYLGANEQKNGDLGYVRDELLPKCLGIISFQPFIRIPELNQPGFHGKYPRVLFRGSFGASKVCPKFDQPEADQCCQMFSEPS